MNVVATNNRDFLTLLAVSAGGIDTLFESALASGGSVDAVPEPGAQLEVVAIPKRYNLPKKLPVLMPVKKLVSLNQQSLQDLTLQTAGSLEHIFEMALLNGVSITDNPVAGAKYSALEAEHSDIVGYYATKGIKPATGLTAEAQLQHLFEAGLFEFGLFE